MYNSVLHGDWWDHTRSIPLQILNETSSYAKNVIYITQHETK